MEQNKDKQPCCGSGEGPSCCGGQANKMSVGRIISIVIIIAAVVVLILALK